MEKKSLSRRGFVKTSLTAAAAAAFVTGASSAKTPRPGGNVEIGFPSLPVGTDPGRFVGGYGQFLLSFTHDALLDLTPPADIMAYLASGKPLDQMPTLQPNLAEGWEESGDGLSLTFTLKPGIFFHNGQELTASDVKWCMDRIKNIQSWRYASVRETKALDKRTVRFLLTEPSATLISALQMYTPIYPKDSLDFNKTQWAVTKDSPHAPGTGPFHWKDDEPGQFIRLQKFTGYRFPNQPYLDTVTLRQVADPTVRLTALRTGELDFIYPLGSAVMAKETQDQDQKAMVSLDKGEYTLYTTDYNLTWSLALNMRKKPLDDIRVRRAIALAMDRKPAALLATGGLGRVSWQHYTRRSTPFWIDGLAWPHQHDIKQARALLDEAGFGKGLELNIILNPQQDTAVKYAQVLQQQLSQAGINLKFEMMQKTAYFARDRKSDFQLMILSLGNTFNYDLDMYYNYFNSTREESWRVNRAGYRSQKASELVEKGRRTMGLTRRLEIYRELYELWARDIPYIPLYQEPASGAWRDTLHGFDPLGAVPDLRTFRQVWTSKA